ncbi:MAG: hypothetical protein IKK92_08630, partial [Prevotella sp.]|nr:hypothetical protein [Prevotella sp.]
MIIDRLAKAWRDFKRMFSYTDIERIVGRNIAFTDGMLNAINDWSKMFNGAAPWTEAAPSLSIEGGICREFADIAINEMEASIDHEELNKLFQRSIRDLNENLQEGLALGGMVVKPYLSGTTVGVEYVAADSFIPIAFDDEGRLRDVVFIQTRKAAAYEYYFRLERHTLTAEGLKITNTAYKSSSRSMLGQKISLASAGWGSFLEEATYQIDHMDFGFFKVPKANRVDGSGCGVSIYAGAEHLIERADRQGARLDWEFESAERAVHVDDRALKHNKKTGSVQIPQGKQRLYRGLNLETNQGDLLKEYSPTLREAGFIAGLETYLRQIEFAVGLAYGDLSDAQYVDKTATEIKAAKQRKFNRVSAIQENLKAC